MSFSLESYVQVAVPKQPKSLELQTMQSAGVFATAINDLNHRCSEIVFLSSVKDVLSTVDTTTVTTEQMSVVEERVRTLLNDDEFVLNQSNFNHVYGAVNMGLRDKIREMMRDFKDGIKRIFAPLDYAQDQYKRMIAFVDNLDPKADISKYNGKFLDRLSVNRVIGFKGMSELVESLQNEIKDIDGRMAKILVKSIEENLDTTIERVAAEFPTFRLEDGQNPRDFKTFTYQPLPRAAFQLVAAYNDRGMSVSARSEKLEHQADKTEMFSLQEIKTLANAAMKLIQAAQKEMADYPKIQRSLDKYYVTVDEDDGDGAENTELSDRAYSEYFMTMAVLNIYLMWLIKLNQDIVEYLKEQIEFYKAAMAAGN
jgi:hypothetical protein